MSYIRIPSEVTIPVTVAQGGTGSTTALGNNRVMVSSAIGVIVDAAAITASRVLVADSNGIPSAATMTTTQLGTTSYWTKYTVLYSALATAGVTNNIELFSLPAKTVVEKVIIKTSIAFLGGLIATYTLSVGIAGTLAKYIAAFDVNQAVGATVFGFSAATVASTPENFSSATSVKVAAISTVGNLDAATQGSVDIYVLTSLLP